LCLALFPKSSRDAGSGFMKGLKCHIEPFGHFDMSYAEVQVEGWLIILAPPNKIDHQPLLRPWKELLIVTALKVLVESGRGVEIDTVSA